MELPPTWPFKKWLIEPAVASRSAEPLSTAKRTTPRTQQQCNDHAVTSSLTLSFSPSVEIHRLRPGTESATMTMVKLFRGW